MKPSRFLSMLASAFVLSALFTPSCFSEGKSEPKLEAKENRLAKEASPYLRQHAKNPVGWYPWGEEAFAQARRENKPILLSIGYSTCHWCHVMERESFEDKAIAKLINESFVPIKLDREERPDVDKVYMTAYQAMAGESGGWPLNMFLTPKLEPFYGGTYFPPTDRDGRPGFTKVLVQLSQAWKDEQEMVVKSAGAIREHLEESQSARLKSSGLPAEDLLVKSADLLLERGDTVGGGWGDGPKFPMPSHLRYLLRGWKRTGNAKMLEFAELTADKMANGGVMDQLGGGFHRYAVDGIWLVPHFEKMLYDQAQLLDFYLDLYQITKKQKYSNVARTISDYVLRDMTSPEGAFYCAEDAQSEDKEGKFFCWTTAELAKLLDAEQFAVTCAYFGITAKGNFYDHSDPEALKAQNVLSVVKSEAWLAEKPERKGLLTESIKRMRDARAKRVRPATDDKVLASWNGIMIGALGRAGLVLGEERYADAAVKAQAFVQKEMWNGKRLAHRWHAEGLDASAQAESYLMMLQATRRRYEQTLDPTMLDFAIALAEASVELFYDKENGGFFESAKADDVLIRLKGDYDGAMPTASSIASLEFLKLAEITGRKDFTEIAERTLKAHGEVVKRSPTSMTYMLQAVDFYYSKHQRLVLAEGENGFKAFFSELGKGYRPNLTVMGNLGKVDSFEQGLKAQSGKTTGYLCEGESCQLPKVDPAKLFRE